MNKKEDIKKLIREYWKAKNRCACYVDTYGTYDDSQMVHWAKRAQTLGLKIAELRKEEESLI